MGISLQHSANMSMNMNVNFKNGYR